MFFDRHGEYLSMSSAGAPTASPPLLLLHPLGSTAEMSWAPLATSLRVAGHRVAAPDLPGHGTSREVPFTWESARSTVHTAADQFGPDKPVLIGHSLGAATAIYAAQRAPDRFAGLILSGAGACWKDRYLRIGLTVAAAVGALAAAAGRREPLAHAAGVRGLEIAAAARDSDIEPDELWSAARQLTKFDVRGTPPPPIPCAVIVLTNDRRMPPGLQRALAKYLGCPYIDVAANHDAPVRQSARFAEGVRTALPLVACVGRTEEDFPMSHTSRQVHDRRDAVVIGAGPAGLAIARQLEHRYGITTLVVDRAPAPVHSWRTRYDNFRLNTTGFLSHLPGQRIPLTAGRWPTREDMVSYFDSYVRRQNIALELGCEVKEIDRGAGGWRLNTSTGEIRTRAIILATGNYRTPIVPQWPGLNHFTGNLVHSGDFTNAWPFRGRDVLVVGAGNSAADIAVQLANAGANRIWLAVRTPPHLVRRAIAGFPSDIFLEMFAWVPAVAVDPVIRLSEWMMWGDLSAYGFDRPPLGLKTTVEQTGRIPTLADELVDVIRDGRVEVVPAVEAIEPDRVILADGTYIPPEVIVAATGFSADLDGLIGHLGVLDDRGKPRGGFASDLGHGMFAIGYGIPPNGPLRAIRRAATPLAGDIATYLTGRPQRLHIAGT